MKTRILRLIMKIAISVAVVTCVIVLSVKAYEFGRAVFNEKTGTEENPHEVTLTISEDESVFEIGGVLESEGLIDSTLVFVVQKYYYGSTLVAGTYTLDSNMTGKEILDILSGTAVGAEEEP